MLYATAIGLGVLGVLVLLATLLLCLLELLRMVLLWREKERYRSFTPQERIFYKKDKLFWLLALWGMDAALGWKTEKTDRALTLRLRFPKGNISGFAVCWKKQYTAALCLSRLRNAP